MSLLRKTLLLVCGLIVAGSARSWSEPPAKTGPEPEKQAKLDTYGDPLPAGTLARMGTTRFRHSGQVYFLAFSPDGKVVASSEGSNFLRLWEVATGKELRRLNGLLIYGFSSFAFSADGKTITGVGEDWSIRTIDVATGKEVRKVAGPQNGMSVFTLSANGKVLAYMGNDQSLRLLDATTGKETAMLAGPPAQPNMGVAVFYPQFLSLSGDGKILAVGGNNGNTWQVKLWDTATAKEIRQVAETPNGFASLTVSPDGKTLAVNDGARQLGLWDIATGKSIRQTAARSQYGNFTDIFSPDSKVVAYANGDAIHLEEAAAGKEIRKIQGQQQGITSLAYSPDGKVLASGGINHMIRFWEADTGNEIRPLGGHQGGVNSVAYSPDGKVVASASSDQTIRLWDPATGKEIRQLARPKQADQNQPNGYNAHVTFARDGKTLAAAWFDGLIALYDAGTGKLISQFQDQPLAIMSMVFSPDSKMLAWAGQDGMIHLREVATGKDVRQFEWMKNPNPGQPLGQGANIVAFSPDGRTLLASGYNNNAYLGQLLRSSSDLLMPAYTNPTATVRLWEIATGKERGQIQIKGNAGGYPALNYFSGIMDARSTLLYVDQGFGGIGVSAAVFSPDGKTLALGDGAGIRLYDLARSREIRRLDGSQVAAYCFTYSPDGKLLAVGGSDGSICLWDLNTGVELSQSPGHRGAVTALSFARDSKTLVSASADTTLLVWDVATLRDEGRRKLVEGLTPKQLESLWTVLAADDATHADKALWTMAGSPKQTLPFLKERLKPAPAVDSKRIAQLIADLDSENFETRTAAMQELEKLGEVAETALKAVLAGQPSLEVRQRVEALIEKLQKPITSPELMRQLRAVEVLEKIGTPEARQILEQLLKGAPEAKLTRDAKDALERLTALESK